MEAIEIVWSTPAPSSTGKKGEGRPWKPKREEIIEGELRKNKGEWVLLKEGVDSRSVPKRFQGAEFQRAYRNYYEDGKLLRRIYVRYVGKEE